jgi:hypothetical protein
LSYYQGTASDYLTLLDELRDFVTDTAGTWAASTSYAVGDFVVPTVSNGYRYRCTEPGTSGTAEPSWPTTIGDTVLDDVSTGDSVTWTCVNALLGADAWVNMEETYVSSTSTDGLLWLEGIGVDAIPIYVGFNTTHNAGVPSYNWELNGAIDWNTGVSFYLQSGALPSGSVPYLLLRNGNITFTFAANSRRIAIIAHVSTVIESAYLGLVNLYMPYNNWPRPILIGGTSGTDIAFTNAVTSTHSWWLQPGTSDTVFIRDAAGTWGVFDIDAADTANRYYIYPSRFLTSTTTQEIATNNDGSYLIMPQSLLYRDNITAKKGFFAELDGVYWVPGFNLVTGDLLTIGADTYYVFANTFLSDLNSYACLKLE